MRPLTIGIDARAASEVGAGRGRVVRELLRELTRRAEPHRYRCYARRRWNGVQDQRLEWILVDSRDPLWNLRVARRATRECDVFLSSNSYLTTWFLGVPGVPIVYDLVTFDPAMKPNWSSALIERLTIGLAVRRSAAFIAISATTARALADRYPQTAGRTTTALLGVAPTLDPAPGGAELVGLPEPGFVLAVGTLEPRKNLPRLVEAYRQLAPDLQARHPLVVVGALGWQSGETRRALDSLGDRAIALGYVADAALAEMYRRCALFCYPSLGEGFGLPVLEALAGGAPVLTSSVSSLPEVGGDAVAYADPRDVDALAEALRLLLNDAPRRAELARRGPLRAAGFSWARFAEVVIGALEASACNRASAASSRPGADGDRAGAPPLVSIGIPTYNRAVTLERTLRCARAQTHVALEILVYDNASVDETRRVAERHAREDKRVRYVRQERNLGPTANFNALFADCRGDWVMMLADDDWPAENYVESCLAAHRALPGAALVSGVAVYHRGEHVVAEGVRVQLLAETPAGRVRGYYEQVRDNGAFYGLMPAEVLRRAAPLRNVLGNDWLLVAAVAFQGTVHTIDDTLLHRAMDGTSVDVSSIGRAFGSSSWQARVPHLVIAAQAFADIAWRAEVYRELSPPARLTLGVGAARRCVDWRSLAWHVVTPLILSLRFRRRGRTLYRTYDRLARRLGGGGLPPVPVRSMPSATAVRRRAHPAHTAGAPGSDAGPQA